MYILIRIILRITFKFLGWISLHTAICWVSSWVRSTQLSPQKTSPIMSSLLYLSKLSMTKWSVMLDTWLNPGQIILLFKKNMRWLLSDHFENGHLIHTLILPYKLENILASKLIEWNKSCAFRCVFERSGKISSLNLC